MRKTSQKTTRVKVISKTSRPCLLLRWVDRGGQVRQESTGVPVGLTAREQRINRIAAQRLAADKEKALLNAEAQAKSLLSAIGPYAAYHRSLGHSPTHIRQIQRQLRTLFNECRWSFPGDIDGRSLSQWMDSRRQKKGTSYRTLNSYLETIKAFCGWLVSERELAGHPIAYLRRRNDDEDRRRERRALSSDELHLVCEAAKHGPTRECIPGPTRAIVYLVAAYTGLRAKELSSVTRAAVNTRTSPPTITVAASHSKRRREDTLPLHPAVAESVQAWLETQATLSIHRPVFGLLTRGGCVRRVADAFQADLTDAREKWIVEAPSKDEQEARKESDFLAYQNHDGHFADFHGLRHTFVTSLARAGISLVQAQKLARHSDPRLTAQVYTHLGLADATEAISQLPSPGPTQKKKLGDHSG